MPQLQFPREFSSRLHFKDEIEGILSFLINVGHRLSSSHQKFSIVRNTSHAEIAAAFGEEVAQDVFRQIGFRLIDHGFYAARLRDNEFGVLCGQAEQQEIDSVLEKLNEPVRASEYNIPIKVIVGSCDLALAEDAKNAIRQARSALLHEKNTQKVHYYEHDLAEQLKEGIRTHNELERAINEEQDIELWYQPQFNLLSGTTDGVEALVRWMRNGELVNPSDFIPMAEKNGLMEKLGRLVIKKAFHQIAQWQRDGHQFNVAINLSALQLEDAKLILAVDDLLGITGIETSGIEFELTETATSCANNERKTIRDLKKRGFLIAMDDFGIGYSSLERLANKHYDKLKIDKEFVKNAPQSETHRKICEMAISLAKILDIKVIAEGIETPEQEAVMKEIGCTLGQGFLYSKPVKADELPMVMQKNKEKLIENNLRNEEIQNQQWFRRIVQIRNKQTDTRFSGSRDNGLSESDLHLKGTKS